MDKALKPITTLFILCLLLQSCVGNDKDCKDVACTAIFKMITVTVIDSTQQKIQLDRYYTIKTSNNDTLDYTATTIEKGVFVVVDDNQSKSLQNTQDDFRFIGILNNTIVVDEPYVIGADCCHIDLISGSTEVTLQ